MKGQDRVLPAVRGGAELGMGRGNRTLEGSDAVMGVGDEGLW